MATYEFRCTDDGVFDVVAPMGKAGQRQACPTCGHDSARVFAAPMLGLADRRIVAALDRADKTRDEPDVVTSLPASGARKRTRTAPPNPALNRLPRP
ncbi:MAG: zinc ribbon domain-containing protein [Euzebyaceae bacterium]|nr:zinc ribbon domain-containing protein [Euzebyaceae bacterium]